MTIRRWQLAGFTVVLLAFGALVSRRDASREGKPQPPVFRQTKAARKVYPYSVIPGGVGSAVELRNALAGDRVASTHYAGFQLDRTRVEHLDRPKKVFVSYRIANHVYWTQNRVSLPKGEAILTDGTSSARTRCGNRLSETPQLPVNSASEPAPSVLETEMPESWQADGWEDTAGVTSEVTAEAAEEGSGHKGDYQEEFGPQAVTSMADAGSERAGTSAGRGSSGGGGGAGGGGGGANAGGGASGGASSTSPAAQTSSLDSATAPGTGAPPGSVLQSASVLPSAMSTAQALGISVGGGSLFGPAIIQGVSGTQYEPMSVFQKPVFAPSLPFSFGGSLSVEAAGGSFHAVTMAPSVAAPSSSESAAIVSAALRTAASTSETPYSHSAVLPDDRLMTNLETPEPHTLLLVLGAIAFCFFGIQLRQRRARS